MKTKRDRLPKAADVAAYFEGNEDTDYQARMIRECGRRVKSYPFRRVVTNPYLLACHHRFCPNCQQRRAQGWSSALRAVIDEESVPSSTNDIRLGPYWIAITLPGMPCATSELRNQLETLFDYLSIASNQQFWRFGILTGLRLLRLEVDRTADHRSQVTPSFECFLNVSRSLFNAQTQAGLLQRIRRDWVQPVNPANWPGPTACVLPTATTSERDSLQLTVSRMIKNGYPYPDSPTFRDIAEQTKGVKTMVVHRSQRTPFRPLQISHADDLRYEREYSVSRVGEDLQESLSGNTGLDLLPWHLPQ